jgi:hypothetical protein
VEIIYSGFSKQKVYNAIELSCFYICTRICKKIFSATLLNLLLRTIFGSELLPVILAQNQLVSIYCAVAFQEKTYCASRVNSFLAHPGNSQFIALLSPEFVELAHFPIQGLSRNYISRNFPERQKESHSVIQKKSTGVC